MAASGVETVRPRSTGRASSPTRRRRRPRRAATRSSLAGGARAGCSVLPIVHGTPGWAASDRATRRSPPRDPGLRRLPARAGRPLRAAGLAVGRAPRARRAADPRVADLERAEPHALLDAAARPGLRAQLREAAARRAPRAARRRPGRAHDPRRARRTSSWIALRAIYQAGGARLVRRRRAAPVHGQAAQRACELVRVRAAGDAPLRRRPQADLDHRALAGRRRRARRRTRPASRPPTAARRRGSATALRLLARARKRLRIERVFWYTWLSTRGLAELVRLVRPAAACATAAIVSAPALRGVPDGRAAARGLRARRPRDARALRASRPRARPRRRRARCASQLNAAARARPAARSRSRSPASPSSASSASRTASPSGGTSSAAPPQVSGSAAPRWATTGVPDAIASSTGSPKPSYARRQRERLRARVEPGQQRVGHVAEQPQRLEARLGGELRAVAAGDHDVDALARERPRRGHERAEVLARRVRGDAQHVRPREARAPRGRAPRRRPGRTPGRRRPAPR